MRKSQQGKGGKCLGLDPGLKVDQVNMGPDAAYSRMTSLDLSKNKEFESLTVEWQELDSLS